MPSETSNTAAEVLSLMIDGPKKDESAPCHKTCDVCQATYLTEKTWEDHFKSNRHRRVLKRKKRRALVVVDQEPTETLLESAPPVEVMET